MNFRYKERPLTFNFSWKWTVFHASVILLNDKNITFSLMCFRSRSPIRLRHSHHLKLLFLCFSVTLVKPEKPLKVPEVEKFYKLPDSRAVVKFRINTGFTASCFFGTLLVAFAQIKDFYILIRCSATIVSTWLDRSGLCCSFFRRRQLFEIFE